MLKISLEVAGVLSDLRLNVIEKIICVFQIYLEQRCGIKTTFEEGRNLLTEMLVESSKDEQSK